MLPATEGYIGQLREALFLPREEDSELIVMFSSCDSSCLEVSAPSFPRDMCTLFVVGDRHFHLRNEVNCDKIEHLILLPVGD